MRQENPNGFEQFVTKDGKHIQVLLACERAEDHEKLIVYQELSGPMRILAENRERFLQRAVPFVPSGEETVKAAPASVRPQEPVRDEETSSGSGQADDSGYVLDPLVEKFLDAGTTDEKLDILSELRPRVTNDMIDTMALASGLEIDKGDVAARFDDLKECLITIRRYEVKP